MSFVSAAGALSAAGLPPVDQSQLPAAIRTGGPAAKNAYETALGFEQVLVDQLAQELTATVADSGDGSSASDGSGGDGSGGDGSSDATGLMGSDPASSEYAQLLPQALTSSIMSAGGVGIAQEIATSLDPSIASRR
jgi:hypothetical protein